MSQVLSAHTDPETPNRIRLEVQVMGTITEPVILERRDDHAFAYVLDLTEVHGVSGPRPPWALISEGDRFVPWAIFGPGGHAHGPWTPAGGEAYDTEHVDPRLEAVSAWWLSLESPAHPANQEPDTGWEACLEAAQLTVQEDGTGADDILRRALMLKGQAAVMGWLAERDEQTLMTRVEALVKG